MNPHTEEELLGCSSGINCVCVCVRARVGRYTIFSTNCKTISLFYGMTLYELYNINFHSIIFLLCNNTNNHA
jgi:hypothetical protein